MIYDLQKADVWKRASAGLFDLIMKVIGAVGFIFLLSLVVGFNSYSERYESRQNVFEAQYNVSFDNINNIEDYEKLSADEKALIDEAFSAFAADEEANYLFNMLFQLTIITVTFGILLSYLVFDFIIPMFFKNGQTLGKKVFGVAVMRLDNVKISGPILFIRSILGKYTIETMVPVMLVLMTAFGVVGGLGVIVALIVILANIIMMLVTRTNSGIHDMLANTVVVDLQSQMIFDSPEALLEYKQKVHAESAEKAEY
jgi:uncharacterized RDD family membrane protein YckC